MLIFLMQYMFLSAFTGLHSLEISYHEKQDFNCNIFDYLLSLLISLYSYFINLYTNQAQMNETKVLFFKNIYQTLLFVPKLALQNRTI